VNGLASNESMKERYLFGKFLLYCYWLV